MKNTPVRVLAKHPDILKIIEDIQTMRTESKQGMWVWGFIAMLLMMVAFWIGDWQASWHIAMALPPMFFLGAHFTVFAKSFALEAAVVSRVSHLDRLSPLASWSNDETVNERQTMPHVDESWEKGPGLVMHRGQAIPAWLQKGDQKWVFAGLSAEQDIRDPEAITWLGALFKRAQGNVQEGTP